MKSKIFAAVIGLALTSNVALADSFNEEVINAFNNSEEVQAEIDEIIKSDQVEKGDILLTLVDSSNIIGFAGTEGHQTYLVSQILTNGPALHHFTTSVSAYVRVDYESRATFPTVSDPELYPFGDIFLDTIYTGIQTTKQPEELEADAVERALRIYGADLIADYEEQGFQVAGIDVNRLSSISGYAGIDSVYAASIHLVSPYHNGGEVVLFGTFLSESPSGNIRGSIRQ